MVYGLPLEMGDNVFCSSGS